MIVKKICNRCKKDRDIDDYSKKLDGKDSRCNYCLRKIRTKSRYDRKLEGIAAYGGKCKCCGESNPVFLTIDHINGREKGDKKKGSKLWHYLQQLGWPTDNYQLLCFNCNCAKGILGYCPHKKR